MRFSAALFLLTFASLSGSVAAAPAGPDKKACFKLAEDGQDLRIEGKLRDARAKFLECARDPCPAVVKNDCGKWLNEVEAALPSIVIRVSKDAEDVPVVRVMIDGVDVGYVEGKPIVVDPGTRKLVIEPKGVEPIEQTVIIVSGEKNRVVAVMLDGPKAEPPPPRPPPKAPVVVESPRVWPWIAAGVGVVGLAGFGYFALSANAGVKKLEDRGCEPRCPDSDVRSIKTKYLIGDIALGVSIVSFAIATYGFASGPSKSTTTVSIGNGFVSVQGSF